MSTSNEPFVVSPMRDNWYQTSSYYVSSFALITTVDENGLTSIGPYQLSFPFEVIERRSWMVVSRPNSNTHKNVSRTLKCAMNFIEYDREKIEMILKFGFPGQEPEEKMAYNDYELIDSPTPGRESNDIYPKIIKDAYQVYECTLDIERINIKYGGARLLRHCGSRSRNRTCRPDGGQTARGRTRQRQPHRPCGDQPSHS